MTPQPKITEIKESEAIKKSFKNNKKRKKLSIASRQEGVLERLKIQANLEDDQNPNTAIDMTVGNLLHKTSTTEVSDKKNTDTVLDDNFSLDPLKNLSDTAFVAESDVLFSKEEALLKVK